MKNTQDSSAGAQYMFAKKPEEISFIKFLYNNSTGEILGRSVISWGELIIINS